MGLFFLNETVKKTIRKDRKRTVEWIFNSPNSLMSLHQKRMVC